MSSERQNGLMGLGSKLLVVDAAQAALSFLGLRDVQGASEAVCEEAVRLFGARIAHVLTLGPKRDKLNVVASFGVKDVRWRGISIRVGEGNCGRAALEKAVILEDHFLNQEGELSAVGELREVEGFRCSVYAPLETKDGLLGVLWLCYSDPTTFVGERLSALAVFADLAAVSIDNAVLNEELADRVRSTEELFTVLGKAFDHESLAQVVCNVSGNPVVFYDDKLDFLACYPPSFEGLVIGEAESLKAEINKGGHPEHMSLLTMTEENRQGLVISAGEVWDWPFDRALAAGFMGDEVLGHVEIIGVHRRLTQSDAQLAFRAAHVLALQITRERMAAALESRLRGELIDDLLSGTDEALDRAGRRSGRLGHDLTGGYFVAVLEMIDLSRMARERGWSARHVRRLELELSEVAAGVFSAHEVKALIGVINQRVVLIAYGLDRQYRETQRLRKLSRSLINGMIIKTSDIPIVLGVGSYKDKREEIKDSFEQALNCTKLYWTLGVNTKAILYEDLGIASLLALEKDSKKIYRYINEIIGPVFIYDGNNNTKLYETLKLYLDSNCSIVRTARKLNIHVNTVKYRINKIRNVLDWELVNVDKQFDIHLAIKMKSAIESIEE